MSAFIHFDLINIHKRGEVLQNTPFGIGCWFICEGLQRGLFRLRSWSYCFSFIWESSCGVTFCTGDSFNSMGGFFKSFFVGVVKASLSEGQSFCTLLCFLPCVHKRKKEKQKHALFQHPLYRPAWTPIITHCVRRPLFLFAFCSDTVDRFRHCLTSSTVTADALSSL